MARRARLSRGVSMIEAMVSLAVMAFGTLAVLGVHTGLRLSADVAKQRSEGVRIAQETVTSSSLRCGASSEVWASVTARSSV